MLKSIFFIVLFSISLVAQAAGIGNFFGALMGKSGAIESESALDDVLVKVSQQMNKKMPIPVDNDTRLDSVSTVPGKHLIYHYTLVNVNASDVSADTFHAVIEPQLKSRLCANTDMQNFLKHGVTVSYLYKDKNGQPVGGAKFAPSECGYKQ